MCRLCGIYWLELRCDVGSRVLCACVVELGIVG